MPPDGLSDDALVGALTESWGLAVASIDYRAVGFGSHHWTVVDTRGARWFVTVDDLGTKRYSETVGGDAAFRRLRAALGTAGDLRHASCAFVVAPVPTSAGTPLVRMDRRFAVSLYPHVDGQSYAWGEFSTATHRRAVLDLVVALHTVPITVAPHALTDDFSVPLRDELEASLDLDGAVWDGGPYARPTSMLLEENAERIRRLFARYDNLVTLVKEISGWPSRAVVTHGEPHAANTMLTADGWLLIDWDTVLLAPAERDLWSLDPGDGSIVRAYADATGTTPMPSALALYRIRWDLSEIALYASRFREQHAGSADDVKSWDELRSLIAQLRG
jgi:hypothetical protein